MPKKSTWRRNGLKWLDTAALGAMLGRQLYQNNRFGGVPPKKPSSGPIRNTRKPNRDRKRPYVAVKNKKKATIIFPKVNGSYTQDMVVTKYKPNADYKINKKVSNPQKWQGILTTHLLNGVTSASQELQLVAAIKEWGTPGFDGDASTLATIANYAIPAANSIGVGRIGRKMVLDYAFYETSFTNQTPIAIKLTLIDVVTKVSRPLYTQSTTDWVSGYSAYDGPSTSLAGYPGAMPTESKQFNMNWNIVKKTQIHLDAGQTHYHKKLMRWNRCIDYQYYNDYNMIKGMNTELVVIAEGMPVNATQGLVSSNIALADIKLIVVQKFTVQARVAAILEKYSVQRTNALTAGMVNMWAQDEDGDVVDMKITQEIA